VLTRPARARRSTRTGTRSCSPSWARRRTCNQKGRGSRALAIEVGAFRDASRKKIEPGVTVITVRSSVSTPCCFIAPMPQEHRGRRSIRLRRYDYTAAGAYFITICTQDRECLFGHVKGASVHYNPFGKIATECWQQIPEHFPNVRLDEWVVMPNHV